MKINQRYNGSIIGAMFFVGSVLSIFIRFLPLMSLFPATAINAIASSQPDAVPKFTGGQTTLVIYIILFGFSLLLITRYVDRIKSPETVKNSAVVVIMGINYFIVHPLGLYLYYGLKFHYGGGGGQDLLTFLFTMPFSSASFILIGLLIDFMKQKAKP